MDKLIIGLTFFPLYISFTFFHSFNFNNGLILCMQMYTFMLICAMAITRVANTIPVQLLPYNPCIDLSW